MLVEGYGAGPRSVIKDAAPFGVCIMDHLGPSLASFRRGWQAEQACRQASELRSCSRLGSFFGPQGDSAHSALATPPSPVGRWIEAS